MLHKHRQSPGLQRHFQKREAWNSLDGLCRGGGECLQSLCREPAGERGQVQTEELEESHSAPPPSWVRLGTRRWGDSKEVAGRRRGRKTPRYRNRDAKTTLPKRLGEKGRCQERSPPPQHCLPAPAPGHFRIRPCHSGPREHLSSFWEIPLH